MFAVGASVALVGAGAAASALALTSGVAAAQEHANFIFQKTIEAPTATPIKHVVVIFDENVSFDHYFGTYPDATNADGEPFYAAPGTPGVNGLAPNSLNGNVDLLTSNPNASQPQRLDPGTNNSDVNDIVTCDQNHDYTPEQYAFDGGKMDQFEATLGTATATGTSPTGQACAAGTVMDYYDGNTVTAAWNYAQHFAMSDNNFGSTFGPSTVGALNVTAGNTSGVDPGHAIRNVLAPYNATTNLNPYVISAGPNGGYTDIGDAQPYWDDCATGAALALTGENIGDQLNTKDLSWGWFQGGFTPTNPYSGPVQTASTYDQLNDPDRVTCTATHNVGAALGGTGKTGANAWGTDADYSAHYDAFMYFASTANPHHLAPASLDVVGTDTATPGEFDTANHNYDVSQFNQLASAISNGTEPASHLPAVTYLKAPVYETGHPATSDPIDEQNWLVNEVNAIEQLPTWRSTAIFVTYDDSDGWYDHVYSGVTNPSESLADTLTGAGSCGTEAANQTTVPLYDQQGRCGYGPRLPLIVISPWAKQNYVSHALTDQSSIVAFIEKNWGLGQIPGSFANIAGSLNDLFDWDYTPSQLDRPLFLSPTTGEPSYPVEGAISPADGPAGTSVTISGLGFSTVSGQTRVYFGSRPGLGVTCAASTTLDAPATTCTATAPPGPAGLQVPLTVRVNGVAAINDAGEYTYTT
jgi:phospholipase C